MLLSCKEIPHISNHSSFLFPSAPNNHLSAYSDTDCPVLEAVSKLNNVIEYICDSWHLVSFTLQVSKIVLAVAWILE